MIVEIEMASSPSKTVFVDRDGTILVEPPDQQVDSLNKMEFVPGIIRGLRLLCDAGLYPFRGRKSTEIKKWRVMKEKCGRSVSIIGE